MQRSGGSGCREVKSWSVAVTLAATNQTPKRGRRIPWQCDSSGQCDCDNQLGSLSPDLATDGYFCSSTLIARVRSTNSRRTKQHQTTEPNNWEFWSLALAQEWFVRLFRFTNRIPQNAEADICSQHQRWGPPNPSTSQACFEAIILGHEFLIWKDFHKSFQC